MDKQERLREASDRGAGYLANVILSWHRNPQRKMRGLLNLLRAGHTVNIAQHSIDTLLIDGVVASWIVLEEWASRTA